MSDLKSIVVPCGYAGLDTESAADTVLEGHAPEHVNFLVHHDYEMRMRGPLASHTTLTIGSNVIVTGIWGFGNKALVGLATADATAVREPWTAPFRPATAAQLAEPVTTMKLIDFDALTVSDVSAAQGTVIGGKGVRIGAYVYGFAYSAGTDDDIDPTAGSQFVHRRALLRWDGTTSAPTAVTDAVDSGQDVAVHYNRLFALGGRDVPGGGTAHNLNSLYFTDNGGPISGTAASWQDDVSGLTNQIVIDGDNPDDFGVGLAHMNDKLAIFKRRSTHLLTGYSSDTFALSVFSSDIGCVDARSIIEHDDGCYFLSAEGYMYFDGSVLENVSGPIQSELVTATDLTVGSHGTDGGKAFAQKLPNHYILLTLANQTFSTGALGTVQKSYLFHAPTRRWSRFTSNATANTIPVAAGRSAYTPFIIDGAKAVKTEYLTLPEAAATSTRGLDVVAGTTRRIPSKWKSPIIRMATPFYMAQIHRILVDYTFRLHDGADSDQDAWYVSLQEGTGRDLVDDPYQLYAMADDSAYLYRRRNVYDDFYEVADCQLTVEWYTDGVSYPAVADARIYDCYLEYQITRQRRST